MSRLEGCRENIRLTLLPFLSDPSLRSASGFPTPQFQRAAALLAAPHCRGQPSPQPA